MAESVNRNIFDLHAAEWDANPDRAGRSRAVAGALFARLPLSRNMTVMDFAAGTGMLTLLLQPHVGRITAVDGSQGMLEVLTKKLESAHIESVETLLWNIEERELPPAKYDLIVSTMTMHHVRDVQNALRQFYRDLNSGGSLAVADLDRENGDYHADNEGVEHFGFDREKLKTLFAETGFVEIEDQTVYVVRKQTGHGAEKAFPVFLITTRKQP